MFKSLLYFSVFSLLLPLSAYGFSQTVASDSTRFDKVQVHVSGDTLFVSFDYHVSPQSLKATQSLRLTPRYISDSTFYDLPSILINGRTRARFYAREQAALSHEAYWSQKNLQVLTMHKDKVSSGHYKTYLFYPVSHSNQGRLIVDATLESCCRVLQRSSTTLYADSVVFPAAILPPVGPPPIFESNVSFIRPVAETVKSRQAALSVRINFLAGKHDLLPDYRQNRSELSRVDSILRPISSRPDLYTITQAYIRGYASPEAPYASNLSLSQRRATVFKEYLNQTYGLGSLTDFPATGLGEDWDGLRQSLLANPVARQQQVLYIIDHVANPDARERRLKSLAGGVPYRQLLSTYFPPLRRMEMGVRYDVRALKTEEAEVMIDGRPQDLSAAEFFDVARKRNSDQLIAANRIGYGREYYTATEHFSHDTLSWVNASSAALIRGELQEALTFLQKAGQSPYTYNNYGVYYWLKEDISRSEEYFQRALSVDALRDTARYNLRLLQQWKAKQSHRTTTD